MSKHIKPGLFVKDLTLPSMTFHPDPPKGSKVNPHYEYGDPEIQKTLYEIGPDALADRIILQVSDYGEVEMGFRTEDILRLNYDQRYYIYTNIVWALNELVGSKVTEQLIAHLKSKIKIVVRFLADIEKRPGEFQQ